MKLKLNKWQVMLLFLPFMASVIISQIPYSNRSANQVYFLIENLLAAFDLSLVICYQAYLAISFNNIIKGKSKWFNINACIPVAFTVIHLLYVFYCTFVKQVHSNVNRGPIKVADHNLVTIFITIFLLHAGITFFFINYQFVSKCIKNIGDVVKQEKLKAAYLSPMRWLVKISIIVMVISLIVSIIGDIIKYNNHTIWAQ